MAFREGSVGWFGCSEGPFLTIYTIKPCNYARAREDPPTPREACYSRRNQGKEGVIGNTEGIFRGPTPYSL